jgi:TolA-binding protein
MKMLKVFSTQLRKVHKKVADITASSVESPEDGLFHTGEYYLKNRQVAYARHVFSRYLTYYPAGKYAAVAARCLEGAVPTRPAEASPAPAQKAPAPAKEAPATEAPARPESGGAPDAAKTYYDALTRISQKMYQQAYDSFKKIIAAGVDDEYIEKSYFDMGRCLFFLTKYEDCIKFYTQMLIKYPQHPSLAEALYHIGQSHEKQERKAQAENFYKKALGMVQADDGGVRSRIKKALEKLEK